MDIFITSTLLVAIAEIGDKTQLLAILLAARFKRPLPIIAGIFAATIANHALAAWAGQELAEFFASDAFRYLVALGFIVMAGWTLIPDKVDEDEITIASGRGAFWATTIAFFLVEIGDKTQVATIALAAQFQNVLLVTAGTTLGMMLANVPAVYAGDYLTTQLSLTLIRRLAAAMFLIVGIAVIAGLQGWL